MHTVNNLAEVYGVGTQITRSFSEIIDQKPEEERTAEEIKQYFITRLNGVKNESI